jgi:hypothetical protein
LQYTELNQVKKIELVDLIAGIGVINFWFYSLLQIYVYLLPIQGYIGFISRHIILEFHWGVRSYFTHFFYYFLLKKNFSFIKFKLVVEW